MVKKLKLKILLYALISTSALSSHGGGNCPPGYSISITGSGSGNCGATDSFSVSTQNSWDTYSWSITPVAGTVLKAATLSSPSSQSTDVTAYFLHTDDTTFTCSWTLKCTATAGNISCEANKTISITVPDEAGEFDAVADYNIAPTTNAQKNKYWIPTYCAFWLTGTHTISVDPSLSQSVFYTKIYKHEEKHKKDCADTSYVSQFISQSIYEQELQNRGLMSESTTPATTFEDIWIEAGTAAQHLWGLFLHDAEDRAYIVSDPIPPQVLYMSYNADY